MSFNFSFQKTFNNESPVLQRRKEFNNSKQRLNNYDNYKILMPKQQQKQQKYEVKDFNLLKQIQEYNAAHQKLLSEYYKKRHLLLNVINSQKQITNQFNQQYALQTPLNTKNLQKYLNIPKNQKIQQLTLSKQYQQDENPNVISIFRKKTNRSTPMNKVVNLTKQVYPQNPKQQLNHFTNNQKSVQQQQKSLESFDQQQGSFYAAYLKIQQQKLEKQKNTLNQINKKLQNVSNNNILKINKQNNDNDNSPTNSETRTFPGLNKKKQRRTQQINFEDIQCFEQRQDKVIVQFSHILHQILSLQSHKQILKSKLRYKMYQVFKVFKFTDIKLEKKKFLICLQQLLNSKNFHNFQLNQIATFIFGQNNTINRQKFSQFFITQYYLMQEQDTPKSPPKRRQSTIQLLKGYFCDIIQIQYFENKLKGVIHEQRNVVNSIFNELSNSNYFSEQDIIYFLHEKIKMKSNVEVIRNYYNRILKRNRKGKFSKNDYFIWLTR